MQSRKIVAAGALAAVLAGCGGTVTSPPPAAVGPTPTPRTVYVTPAPTEEVVNAPTEEPTVEPEPTPVPAAGLVPIGKFARTGDWDVRVTGKPNMNAWKVVHAENMFNDVNPKGTKMVLIPIEVVNRGAESTTLLGEAGYVVGDANGVEISDFDDPNCGVIPKELDQFKTVRVGGKLKGNMCFVVEDADLKTLRLGWPSGLFSDEPDVEFALR